MVLATRSHYPNLIIALLLMVNGVLVAGMLALSKVAQAGGLSPIAYGFWMTLGGGLLLSLGALITRPSQTGSKQGRYWLISGLLSIAIPQLLIFIAVGKIGAGLAGVAFALPTLTTWLMARALGLEAHSHGRMAGAGLGAVGALLLLIPSAGALPVGAAPWMMLALLAPVVIAGGNIYRQVAWPPGARPVELAAGMLMVAAAVFLFMALVFQAPLRFWRFESVTPWVLAQMPIAAVQFLAYFALQKRAKPVIFSLIGQIALIAGMVMGAALLGETYSGMALTAVGIMLAGLLCMLVGRPGPVRGGRLSANG